MKAVKRMWFEWGDEPVEHCHVWHVGRNGDVMFDGIMSIERSQGMSV